MTENEITALVISLTISSMFSIGLSFANIRHKMSIKHLQGINKKLTEELCDATVEIANHLDKIKSLKKKMTYSISKISELEINNKILQNMLDEKYINIVGSDSVEEDAVKSLEKRENNKKLIYTKYEPSVPVKKEKRRREEINIVSNETTQIQNHMNTVQIAAATSIINDSYTPSYSENKCDTYSNSDSGSITSCD